MGEKKEGKKIRKEGGTEMKTDGQKNGLTCGTAEREIKRCGETGERGKNSSHPDGLRVLVPAAVRFNKYEWMETSSVHQYHRKRRKESKR